MAWNVQRTDAKAGMVAQTMTIAGGGGYGTLRLFVPENAGLYEGSTLSMMAIATGQLFFFASASAAAIAFFAASRDRGAP